MLAASKNNTANRNGPVTVGRVIVIVMVMAQEVVHQTVTIMAEMPAVMSAMEVTVAVAMSVAPMAVLRRRRMSENQRPDERTSE